LSETLNLGATNVLEVEYQDNVSRNSVGENIDFDTLTPLIEANANVLVRCPWLDNEAVILSTASIAYSDRVALITHENINEVASVMRELLADPVIDTEDLDEQNHLVEEDEQDNTYAQIDEIIQASNTEAKVQETRKDLSSNDDEKPLKIVAEVAMPLGEIVTEVVEPFKPEGYSGELGKTATILNAVKQRPEHPGSSNK
jgi:Na+-translocating ferredoxin:NAD+ oxidoreductase RnfG subunit